MIGPNNTLRHHGYEALSYSFSSVHTTYLQKDTINCDLTDIQSMPTTYNPVILPLPRQRVMGYSWSRDKEHVRGTLDQEEGRRGVRNTHWEVNIKRKREIKIYFKERRGSNVMHLYN